MIMKTIPISTRIVTSYEMLDGKSMETEATTQWMEVKPVKKKVRSKSFLEIGPMQIEVLHMYFKTMHMSN